MFMKFIFKCSARYMIFYLKENSIVKIHDLTLYFLEKYAILIV